MSHREQLIATLRGLMLSEHLGDVHDEIIELAQHLGLDGLEGDFFDGWTDKDWASVDDLGTHR